MKTYNCYKFEQYFSFRYWFWFWKHIISIKKNRESNKNIRKINSWVGKSILSMKTYDFDQRDLGKYQKRIGIYICGGAAGAHSERADQPLASNMQFWLVFCIFSTFCMHPYDFFHFSDFLFVLHMKTYDFDRFEQYFSFRHSFRIWKHIISIEKVSGM